MEVAKYFNEQSATFAFGLNLNGLTPWISLSFDFFDQTWNPLERVALCEPHPPHLPPPPPPTFTSLENFQF